MRLMHPLHGWHVASSADDVASMRKAGWIDDDGKAIAAKRAAMGLEPAVEPVAAVEVPAPAVPIKRGPGRPRKA